MTRSNEAALIIDPSWCDPDDLWGIGSARCGGDVMSLARSNPPPVFDPRTLKSVKTRAPRRAVAVLSEYGIQLSSNLKTPICLSTWFDTCWRTPWCRKHCYGQGTRFLKNENLYQSNSTAMKYLRDAPESEVVAVASAVKTICRHYGLENIRWSGIGDLTEGAARVIDFVTQGDPDFIVWGFTRKGDLLADAVPVRDNVVFWCSTDNSMNDTRVAKQIQGAKRHRTALAYATVEGARFRVRPARPPLDYEPQWIASQPQPQPDEFLLDLLEQSPVPVSVVFGYHGRGRTTHVDVDLAGVPMMNGFPECPAVDPLGGGHMRGACQQCGWCMAKPAQREYADLVEHRLNRIVVDNFNRDVGLNDNEPV